MKSVFCKTVGSSLIPVAKLAIKAAGLIVLANNPALATEIIPAATDLRKLVDAGGSNAAMNSLMQEGITALLAHSGMSDPIKAEVNIALGMLQIDGKLPIFDSPTIKDIVDTFCDALGATAPATAALGATAPAV